MNNFFFQICKNAVASEIKTALDDMKKHCENKVKDLNDAMVANKKACDKGNFFFFFVEWQALEIKLSVRK